MIEYKSGERLGFIKKAHTRKSVLVQFSYNFGKCCEIRLNYVKLSKYASFLEKPSKKTFKNIEVMK